MRLAKYRSWISSIQQFVYFENGNYSWIRKTDNVNVFNWDNAQQSTGLLDKNGVEIYEGDVVNIKNVWTNGVERWSHMVGAVVFFECEFQVKDKNDNYLSLHRYKSRNEVIGNIQENKKLLGEGR
jgi:uncharacterized phage protein (TIGR01671 family)